jgi:hypothetical protein
MKKIVEVRNKHGNGDEFVDFADLFSFWHKKCWVGPLILKTMQSETPIFFFGLSSAQTDPFNFRYNKKIWKPTWLIYFNILRYCSNRCIVWFSIPAICPAQANRKFPVQLYVKIQIIFEPPYLNTRRPLSWMPPVVIWSRFIIIIFRCNISKPQLLC